MISIIIPVYNVERYLSRCLQSILDQTYTNFEMILVDDGSTDKSGEICDSFLSDKRCKVIHQTNQGVSSARNRGLIASTGEFVLFVDSDDWLDQEMLEKLLMGIEGADLAMCFHYVVNETPTGECEYVGPKDYDIKELYRTENVFYDILIRSGTLWNKLIKRDAIGDLMFRTNMTYGEDTVFLAECLQHVRTAVIVPECLYYYRRVRNGNVVSSAIDNRSMEYMENIKVVFDCCKAADCPSVGIRRIITVITEIQSKIKPTIMDIFAKRQYIMACNKLARYPSLFDYYAFLTDKRIPLSDKRAVIIIADSFLCLLYKSLKRSKKAAIIRIKSFLSGLHKH